MENIIDKRLAEILQTVLNQKNEIEHAKKENADYIKEVFNDFITVLDSFEKAEKRIKERGLGAGENAEQAIKRLLTAKNRALSVLYKHGIEPVEFENNMVDDNCKVVETEPDQSKADGYILSVEKTGYKIKGKLLRYAEVITVRN